MSDDIEKACASYLADLEALTGVEYGIGCYENLTALVREQVEKAEKVTMTVALNNAVNYEDRIAALEADLKVADEATAHWEAKFNAGRGKRVEALEAESAANYALYEKKCTELSGTIQHIAALEAALVEADNMFETCGAAGMGWGARYRAARAKTRTP